MCGTSLLRMVQDSALTHQIQNWMKTTMFFFFFGKTKGLIEPVVLKSGVYSFL